MVILDEADRMLDMGFREDIENILAATAGGAPDGLLLRDDACRRDPAPHQAASARDPQYVADRRSRR